MVNGIVGMGARAPQVVVVRENEKKKGSGALAQVGNAAITAGGLYGTGKLVKAGANAFNQACIPPMCKGAKLSKFQQVLTGVFNKMGDIMFKHPKMKALLLRAKAKFPNLNSNIKGRVALVTTAGVAALALIARGIYKAGEIAGEHK